MSPCLLFSVFSALYMKLRDSLAMSVGNLARRKGRTCLTLGGVVVGVAALVLMISLAIGLEREVLKAFQSDDALRTLFVNRPPAGAKGQRRSPLNFGAMGLPLTDRDLTELRKLDGVATVVPDLGLFLNLEIDGEKDSEEEFVPVGGLLEAELPALKKYLTAGEVWSDPKERAALVPSRMLALRFQKKPADVIGKKFIFSRAFADEHPPDEEVTFRIAGVLDSERLGIKARQLYVPLERAMELRAATKGGNFPFFGDKKDAYASAEVTAKDVMAVEGLKNQIKNAGYDVLTPTDIMGWIRTIFLVIEGVMACIGAIGLIVSLFGIANTMAMAVLERTREIGIMKALGARNGAIRRVFLAEAASIGLLGGLIGLGLGCLVGGALNMIAHTFLKVPQETSLFHVSLWLAAGSVLFSVAVSMVAGFMPALRASRLDPVQALRYE